MSRNARVILLLLVLAGAVCAAFVLLRPAGEGTIARVTLDGEVVEEIDLSAVTEGYTFTVEGPGGFSNTIEVEPGRIRVREAGCPDQVCVHQGYISDGTVPIVCLPNRLVIEIISGGGDSLDAAAG